MYISVGLDDYKSHGSLWLESTSLGKLYIREREREMGKGNVGKDGFYQSVAKTCYSLSFVLLVVHFIFVDSKCCSRTSIFNTVYQLFSYRDIVTE